MTPISLGFLLLVLQIAYRGAHVLVGHRASAVWQHNRIPRSNQRTPTIQPLRRGLSMWFLISSTLYSCSFVHLYSSSSSNLAKLDSNLLMCYRFYVNEYSKFSLICITISTSSYSHNWLQHKRICLRGQVVLGALYRLFRGVADTLRLWPHRFLTCYTVNRGAGAPPVKSCEGCFLLLLYSLRIHSIVY